MEVKEGNVREARSLYKRCHAKQLQDGGQLSLCQAWQRFEREHGNAEDHFHACLKTEPLLSKVRSPANMLTLMLKCQACRVLSHQLALKNAGLAPSLHSMCQDQKLQM